MPLLAAVMARLRAPDGCPWDREQTHDSLKTHLVEEAYEVIEAVENRDDSALKEELGDLLLQILFHSQIAAEEGRFDLDDVIQGIHDKLLRRHPHVFGELDLKTSREVLQNWEAIKAAEKKENGLPGAAQKSILDGTPENLPPLVRACQLTSRAARVGFDWPRLEDIFAKLEEETGELRQAVGRRSQAEISAEIGDLLFVIANLARHLHVDPEMALRRSNRKFVDRFRYIERELEKEGRGIRDATLQEMDQHWERAKSVLPASDDEMS